jgi:hypothetical protein
VTGRSPSGRAAAATQSNPQAVSSTAGIPSAGFTQGPWFVGWGDGKSGPTCPSITGPTVAGRVHPFELVGRGLETFAIVPSPREGGSAIANARLIAASPELYALVEESLFHLRLDGRAEAYHNRALAALAKARGEA